MERSLDAIRRALKTDAMAHRRDLSKMMRESVMLTRELNALRREAGTMMLQKKAITEAGPLGPRTNPTVLLDLLDLLGIKMKKTIVPGTKVRPSAAADLELSSTWADGSTNAAAGAAGAGFGGKFSKTVNDAADMTTGGAGGDREGRTDSEQGVVGPRVRRSTALRTTSASGKIQSAANAAVSKHDQWEAWREIQMQTEQMRQLEDQLQEICKSMGVDPVQILINIDVNLQSLF
jgi:hypothetical protein